MSEHRSSERGVMLIIVAVMLVALMSIGAFAIDYGVLWMARSNAQNAADAGALAGAVAFAYDSRTDTSASGPAYKAAYATAAANTIHGSAPMPVISMTGLTGPPSCAGGGHGCVQVNVFRDGTNGSTAMPTYLAQIFGVTSQGVKATATAQLVDANAAKCIKPWMIADKGATESYGPSDFGTLLILRAAGGSATFQQADFNQTAGTTCQGGGAACYEWAATHCVGGPSDGTLKVGDPVNGKPGHSTGKQKGATNIWNQDPTAYWDYGTNTVKGSCAETHSCDCQVSQGGDGCANGLDGKVSPRLVPVGLFDPAVVSQLKNGSTPMRKIAGTFILKPGGDPLTPQTAPECLDDENVCGVLSFFPGQIVGGVTGATETSLNVIPLLVR